MEPTSERRRSSGGRGQLSTTGKVSLLLAGCVLVMWIRSYGEGDFAGWETAAVRPDRATLRTSGVYCGRGGLGFGVFFREYADARQIDRVRSEPPMNGQFTYHSVREPHYPFRYGGNFDGPSFAGFIVRRGTLHLDGKTVETDRAVVMPYWFLTLLLLAVPARDLIRAARVAPRAQ
jgi:hypothetical protein